MYESGSVTIVQKRLPGSAANTCKRNHFLFCISPNNLIRRGLAILALHTKLQPYFKTGAQSVRGGGGGGGIGSAGRATSAAGG